VTTEEEKLGLDISQHGEKMTSLEERVTEIIKKGKTTTNGHVAVH
jgi:hypothetical protein